MFCPLTDLKGIHHSQWRYFPIFPCFPDKLIVSMSETYLDGVFSTLGTNKIAST